MNIILGQELNSCNKLIATVRDSMASLKEALNGLNVMSSDVENTFHHVKTNMVLNKYKKMTYPTTFSLDNFIQDLKERALFLESWVNSGFPRRINLSAIMYPDCLLTALLQDHSRSNNKDFTDLHFE